MPRTTDIPKEIIDLLQSLTATEQAVLRDLGTMMGKLSDPAAKRALSIARNNIETGFMWARRAPREID